MLWLFTILVALVFRPPLPVDETRYLSVAWEMWSRGDQLVPHLNGLPYSHKPPLLFWLFQAGWSVFGVNEWWPRLVAPTFGLGSLVLVSLLAKRLWPARDAYLTAPIILIGSLFWALYTSLTLFDLLLCFWLMVGLHGLLDVSDRRLVRGWLLFGLALGMGILSKGPVILVFLLPPALFAPAWTSRPDGTGWGRWYVGLFAGIVFGVSIGLAWAIPAGVAGGEAYRNAIFWGQSAGRVVNAFDHSQPVWWYLPFLPLVMLPWLIWPPLLIAGWRAIASRSKPAASTAGASGCRLLLLTAGVALIVLSLISGKRVHYIIPIFPAFALLAGWVLAQSDFLPAKTDFARSLRQQGPIAILGFVVAIIIIVVAMAGSKFGIADWSRNLSAWWAVPVATISLLLLWAGRWPVYNRLVAIAFFSVIVIGVVHGATNSRLSEAYDLRPLARAISGLQKDGYRLANFGKYHGQYNFLGRLSETIETTGSGEVEQWLKENPKSKIISSHYIIKDPSGPDLVLPFRGQFIAIWDAAKVAADPTVVRRGKRK